MRKTIPGGAAAFAVAFVITGCGGGGSSDSSVSIDGSEVSGAFDIACAKTGNGVALAITDENNETYGRFSAGATLSADGESVTAVTVAGTKGGSNGAPYTLGVGEAGGLNSGGAAEVSIDGTTYTVKGEGMVTDVGDVHLDTGADMVHTEQKPFELVFACGEVVE